MSVGCHISSLRFRDNKGCGEREARAHNRDLGRSSMGSGAKDKVPWSWKHSQKLTLIFCISLQYFP